MSKQLPTVVIVGRMNVGKSTLFNRLSQSIKSITLDYEGVTRDVISDEISWSGRSFRITDTGGVSLRKTTDPILQEVRARALEMVDKAAVIMFVVDGKTGLLPEDREISKLLHKSGKPVILAVNKVDSSASQEFIHEFERLGHTKTVYISAQHGKNIADLLQDLVAALPAQGPELDEEEPRYRVVLLGKPNVGKSSLMNLLLKQERSIVSDQAGTTREAISEKVTVHQEDILITDTPGVRRSKAIDEQLEELMVKSAFRAMDRANIVLLLVDSSEGRLSDQELKLAFYAFKQEHKALIIVYNKQDLVDERIKEDLEFRNSEYEFFLKKVAQISISCKDGKNVGKLFPLIQKVWERHSQQFSDQDLTILFKNALQQRPLFHKTIPLLVYSARQVATAPITIALTVNHPQWFEETQLGFFENLLRKEYQLQGVPVRFVMRKGKD